MKENSLQGKAIRALAREIRASLQTLYEEREAAGLAWIILENITGSRREQIMIRGDEPPDAGQLNAISQILQELMKGKPLQYVLGETEFYGLKFKVTPSVLIPRQETEELVQWILQTEAASGSPLTAGKTSAATAVTTMGGTTRMAGEAAGKLPLSLLDVGTGSGCIAIALKKNLSGAEAWACDISDKALKLASENASLNEAEIRFEHADILDEQTWGRFPSFDIIVSNPPYVTESEKTAMAVNVLDHEPHLALFVGNDDPLRFYRAIANFALQKLRPGGSLYFEINEAFGPQTLELLRETSFQHISLQKDLNGKDRMVRGFK
ncbi:release factor glutamine methyltransferase [Anseongella ginsenosidimutans]|uniref:Release factor glutamine methyltransferase n=1 Tax=Anseongella ginsenosidimutans TaxID=496056 RepID=A0A4R3KSL7_9SPHI|nr:peptide chain release factor N(5)-glutamine methyltransferase [Anseongella ginsenosidimutans]QEC53218.1 peptide chain release factor N(5)-glutamine methyltransferase [Anseongella ginsenosidimutans]TCS87853.1 release factor glutamine methyltransferase [Anseongella ginsenosidimutans]